MKRLTCSLVLLFTCLLCGQSLAVELSGPLPNTYLTNLLHLGADGDMIVNGDINNDYLVDYGGEANIQPNIGERMTGISGATSDPMIWTPLNDDSGGWGNYADNYVRYWAVYVHVPQETAVKVLGAADDNLKIWLNGTLLLESNTTVDATLQAGVNTVIMKNRDGGGGDYVNIKITAPDGSPVDGATYTLYNGTFIESMEVTGGNTGYSFYTDSPMINVALTAQPAEDATIVSYAISESATAPPEGDLAWSPQPPMNYLIATDFGLKTIYAYVKDSNGDIVYVTKTIYYSMTPTVVSDVTVNADYLSAEITWTTADEAIGWLDYGPTADGFLGSVSDPDTPGTQHTITLTGLQAATNYTVAIHSNTTISDTITFETPDPGPFYAGFITEVPTAEVDVAPYRPEGGMAMPTFTNGRKGGNGEQGAVVFGVRDGFSTTHLSVFSHPVVYGGGTGEGVVQIMPPDDIIDPLPGTDANPVGAKMWKFSFLTALQRALADDTTAWDRQPCMKLLSNRGPDGLADVMLKVRYSANKIVLDHAGGVTTLVDGLALNSPYLIECILNMDAGTYRVRVDGTYVGGDFALMTTGKGVGGFEARGGAPVGTNNEGPYFFDEIHMQAVPFVNEVENYAVTDQTSGSPTMTDSTTVDLSFDVFGPGYVKYMIGIGADAAPNDANDPRWIAGQAPATVDLGSPANGDAVTVTTYLLDADGGIEQASSDILYASGDPAITNVRAVREDGGIRVTWNTAIPASGRVLYDLDGPQYDSASDYEPVLSTDHSIVIHNLVPGTVYHYAVESNEVLSADQTVGYLTDPVAIENIAFDQSDFYSVGISWTTSANAVGWVEYGPSIDTMFDVTPFTTYGQTHSVVIGGLQPNTQLAVRIRSNAAMSEVLYTGSRNPGAFAVQFNQPSGAVDLVAYNQNGGMMSATYARKNGQGRATNVSTANNGFTSNYVKLFDHPICYGSSDMGLISITPPAEVLDPIAGTDVNPPGGNLWKFSFDMASERVFAAETDTWPTTPEFKQPGIRLLTNTGADGSAAEIVKVRFSRGGIVLDHQGGVTPIIDSYTANTVYHVEITMDMVKDTFAVSVNGQDIPGRFTAETGVTAKGVGGFEVSGGSDAWSNFETFSGYDNIILAPVKVPNVINAFALKDAETGSPQATNDTTVNVELALEGPGYVSYILELGANAPAPVDENDPRWTAGPIASTLDLGAPASGDELTAKLWLLDGGNDIVEAQATILYALDDPGISDIAALVGDLQATISWDTAARADGSVLYGTSAGNYTSRSAFGSSLATHHRIDIDGLIPNTVYHYVVESNGFRSADQTFDHLTDVPVISNIVVDDPELYSVTISWETDAPAIGWIEYGEENRPLTMSSPYETQSTSYHIVKLTGLTPTTKYDIRVHSNGAQSDKMTIASKNAGIFCLEFIDDQIPEILVGDYDINGGMLRPNFVNRNTESRGSQISNLGGISSNHARFFTHQSDYGAIAVTPPAGVTEPLGTTNVNTQGQPWMFSFDMSIEAACANDLTGLTYKPGVTLFTNLGETGTLDPLFKIYPSANNIVLESLAPSGEWVEFYDLVVSYVPSEVYSFSIELDMETDTFLVTVDGTTIFETFYFLTDLTEKGIGGVEVSGRIDSWQLFQNYVNFDSIYLVGPEIQSAPTWPIEGDANMDCKVNIIDLIFVRNRLNKNVTTGDNWQADVNGDGKVNIIDLIYVRNRLNNRCE